MSSRSKGSRIEREFEKLLLKAGYLVNRAKGSFMFNRSVDLWELFDMEAIPTGKLNQSIYFFQISTRWKSGKDKKRLETFPLCPYRRVFMVRRKDKQGFELKEHIGNGEWKEQKLGILFRNDFNK